MIGKGKMAPVAAAGQRPQTQQVSKGKPALAATDDLGCRAGCKWVRRNHHPGGTVRILRAAACWQALQRPASHSNAANLAPLLGCRAILRFNLSTTSQKDMPVFVIIQANCDTVSAISLPTVTSFLVLLYTGTDQGGRGGSHKTSRKAESGHGSNARIPRLALSDKAVLMTLKPSTSASGRHPRRRCRLQARSCACAHNLFCRKWLQTVSIGFNSG
jgi:hypothetical protein